MSVSVNAAAALNGAGAFATSRRGAVGYEEIAHARSVLGARATAAQVAKMIGRCEADIRPLMGCKSEIEAAVVRVALRPVAVTTTERRTHADLNFTILWEQGVKTATLAARFAMSDGGIRHWANRLGLEPRTIKVDKVIWTPELDAIVKRDFASGRKPATEVAATIPGATKAAVIARAHRQGWCAPRPQKAAA